MNEGKTMISPEDIRQAAYEAFELEYEEIESLVPKHELDSAQELIEGYEKAQESKRQLTRQIDIIINGENAAKQASLCDILDDVKDVVTRLKEAQQRIAELDAELTKAHQEGYKEGVEAALSIAAAQIKIKAYNSSKNPMREDMVKWSDVVAMRDNICANIQALKKEGA